MAKLIHDTAVDTKAVNPVVLNLAGLASFADYLIILGGTSDRQVAAIADNVELAVKKKLGKYPRGVEGRQHAQWILVDYGDVVVHIFQEEARVFYRIEDLWHDAKRVNFAAKPVPVKKTKTVAKKAAVKKKAKAPAKKAAKKKGR